jgi:hypothetical protein
MGPPFVASGSFWGTSVYLTFDYRDRPFDKIRRKGDGNSGQILRTCKLLTHESLPILCDQNHFITTFLQDRNSWPCLSGSLLLRASRENVALMRYLTITGDHELNDVLAGNIPLPQNAKKHGAGHIIHSSAWTCELAEPLSRVPYIRRQA